MSFEILFELELFHLFATSILGFHKVCIEIQELNYNLQELRKNLQQKENPFFYILILY